MIYAPWLLLSYRQRTSLLSPSRVSCHCQRGVTLTELMIVVAIMAVVVSLSGSVYGIITRNRITTYTNEFLNAMIRTRSEAILRGRRVVMCKSTNQTTCASTGNWEQGWIVFVDTDGDAQADTVTDPSEVLLLVHAGLSSTVTISGSTNVNTYIAYLPNGRARLAGGGLQTGTISVCDNVNTNATTKTRSAINLNAVGRARTDKNCRVASTCNAVCP